MQLRAFLGAAMIVALAGASVAQAQSWRRYVPRPAASSGGGSDSGQSQSSSQPGAQSGGQSGGQAGGGSSVSGGTLNLTTNNSQQQIEVVVGPAAGRVQVVGINGGSERNYTGVTRINLRTGSNLDVVTFQIRSAVIPEIGVETGAGNSDVKFIYEIPGGNVAQTRVSVVGGAGHDKVAFEAKSQSRTLEAVWDVRAGEGVNEVVAKTEHAGDDLTSVRLSTVTGAGFDKLAFETTSQARRHDLRLAGTLGAGEDNALFKLDGVRAAQTAIESRLELGNDKDQSEMIIVSRGGAINVINETRGGAGDDVLKTLLEGNGTADLLLVGGTGDDYLDIELSGSIAGRSRQLAESGNDFVKYVVTGPRRFQPTLDGGLGFDQGLGFGRVLGIEEFDRQ